ncbi:Uu.00g023650.m01.CDS01 [Anthostomella pinea]|uniref:Uu.00g023650.m01.CDS01 n=1 Tax=Anthostomella pinea TaxID=933095 RepID=A0AAI8VU84_9PEZI|nr:Uu.00g023650.m01.CDS01 [Anthostomella pinea]
MQMASEAESKHVVDIDAAADHDTPATAHAKARILDACEQMDIDALKTLAVSPGGLLSDALRSQSWPILLGFDPEGTGDTTEKPPSWRDMERHKDEDQVKLDVDRSFVYYPNDNSQAELDLKRTELSDLITEVLRRQPYLCYFQGYHDICQVFLLVLPPAARAPAVARLSALRIRDFMLPTLNPALSQLRLIPSILDAVDPELCAHLSRNEPYFALSDTLTMFAHNVQRYSDIARLFDVLLAREQVFGLYVFTQIVLVRRAELFGHDEPDMLHFTLSKLPQDLDLEVVIRDAARLFAEHPPESLRAWRSISSASALKTTRDVRACAGQSLEDGHRFFDRQVRELEWADRQKEVLQTVWTNRGVILTIAVGVGAFYLRRTSMWSVIVPWWPTRLGGS